MTLYRTNVVLYLLVDEGDPLHKNDDQAPKGTIVSLLSHEEAANLLYMRCEGGAWDGRVAPIYRIWVDEISALERLALALD